MSDSFSEYERMSFIKNEREVLHKLIRQAKNIEQLSEITNRQLPQHSYLQICFNGNFARVLASTQDKIGYEVCYDSCEDFHNTGNYQTPLATQIVEAIYAAKGKLNYV